MLGGSSGINYMMCKYIRLRTLHKVSLIVSDVRGSDQDYDDWAVLADDPSWSSQKMKQYMLKHQTLEPIEDSVTDRSTMPFVGENHGTSGPVRTSFNDWFLPIGDTVIKGCEEATGFDKKPTDPWSTYDRIHVL